MQKGTDLILVTGGTGNQGNAVARQLLAKPQGAGDDPQARGRRGSDLGLSGCRGGAR